MSDELVEEKPSKNYLFLYTGCPENSYENWLYLDLVVNGYDVTIDDSWDSIEDCSERFFETVLARLVNVARLFSRELPLKLRVDKSVIDFIESFEDSEFRQNLKELLKEVS